MFRKCSQIFGSGSHITVTNKEVGGIRLKVDIQTSFLICSTRKGFLVKYEYV